MSRYIALYIVKGSRHPGRCRDCQRDITWALIAARGGKNIPLVASPVVLRESRGDNDVVVEVLGFDQVHRCPERKHAASRPRTATGPHVPAKQSGHADSVFPSFTPERIRQLKQELAAEKPKAPQPGRLW